MSTETEKTETAHVEEHKLPLVPAFVALLIMTITELILASDGVRGNIGNALTPILLLLTAAKATTVGAVFMEVAYDKDTKKIIMYVLIIPLIAVLFLIFTILADWRH